MCELQIICLKPESEQVQEQILKKIYTCWVSFFMNYLSKFKLGIK